MINVARIDPRSSDCECHCPVENAKSELKKRFPMLRVRIYDAQTKTREDVA